MKPNTIEQKPSRKRGFSLIETLTASTLMAIVAVGVLSMTGAHMKSNARSKDHTVEIFLAESRVEALLAVPFNTLRSNAGTYAVLETLNYPFEGYTRLTTLDTAPVGTNGPAVDITVEVRNSHLRTGDRGMIMNIRRTP